MCMNIYIYTYTSIYMNILATLIALQTYHPIRLKEPWKMLCDVGSPVYVLFFLVKKEAVWAYDKAE